MGVFLSMFLCDWLIAMGMMGGFSSSVATSLQVDFRSIHQSVSLCRELDAVRTSMAVIIANGWLDDPTPGEIRLSVHPRLKEISLVTIK